MKRKAKQLFSDRIRFNWGYHDAAGDVKNGRPRTTSFSGQHSITHVSAQYDAAYHCGYCYGLRDARNSSYDQNSDASWIESGAGRLLQAERPALEQLAAIA